MIDIVRSIGLFGFANKGTTSSEKEPISKQETTSIYILKIKNGSKLTIEKDARTLTVVNVDQHFNKFQKKMWKFLLGISVEDYSEE